MANIIRTMGIVSVAILLLMISLLAACSDSDDETPSSMAKPESTPIANPIPEPAKEVVITIGNFTDVTGPSSNPLSVISMALEDMVKYYNEQNFIPGVKLEVIRYDGQMDPAKDMPGYEWLKEQGADLIFTSMPSTATTLKSVVDEDTVVLFTMVPDIEALSPPGYIFCTANTLGNYQSYTLLKWIAENDPDFPKDRPAKIGGAFWAEAYSQTFLDGMEKYCERHPEQYEWEGGYLNNFSFIWGAEVEALKDCDYVMPPGPMQHFVREYRDTGYTAKLIGTDFQIAMYGMVDDLDLWDESDGMLLIRTGPWWNEDVELIKLSKQLLHEYHPGEVDAIIREGPGYQAVRGIYIMMEIIKDTVETVGAENFNSQAPYDAAQSFSLTLYGIEGCHSFTDTKRTSLNYMSMYEIRGSEEDLFRVDPEWIPVVREP